MQRSRIVLVSLVAITPARCYHATVDTGLDPAPTPESHRVWANSWIAG